VEVASIWTSGSLVVEFVKKNGASSHRDLLQKFRVASSSMAGAAATYLLIPMQAPN